MELIYESELYHHGVKGMKWGVRKSKAQRNAEYVKKYKTRELERLKRESDKKCFVFKSCFPVDFHNIASSVFLMITFEMLYLFLVYSELLLDLKYSLNDVVMFFYFFLELINSIDYEFISA